MLIAASLTALLVSIPVAAAAPGDNTFTSTDGTPVHWQRIAPEYGAWSIDQRGPNGPIVFAGVPATLSGTFETQDCQSVGCHLYKLDGGTVQTLTSQGSGYGIMDVGISKDGGSVAAVSIDTDPGVAEQGRLISWRQGQVAVHGLRQQAFAIEDLGVGFAAIAGESVFTSKSGAWKRWLPGPTCAFYDIAVVGDRALLAGFSGTYLGKLGGHPAKHRRRARHRHQQRRRESIKRIGPAADAVWSSRDRTTIAISPISSDSELAISRDGGTTWKNQQLVDQIGTDQCANKAGNDANSCSDNVPGARLDIHAIAGTGPDDLWAFGGRADIPGGRVYRYSGSDRWERVPFPADIWFASDAVVLERGRPLVASMDGIYRADS